MSGDREKLLEIDGPMPGDQLIIFDGERTCELYVDGETIDLSVERANKVIYALLEWVQRSRTRGVE